MSTAITDSPPELALGQALPPGLVVVPDFITKSDEWHLLQFFGEAPRVPGADRNRVLRYGPGVAASAYISGVVELEIPALITRLDQWLVLQDYIDQPSDAITVGEYLPGQALALHTDAEQAGAVVSIVALGGAAELVFERWDTLERYQMTFHPRMLVQLAGPVRYTPWQHAILPVTERRLSVTFRRALS